MYLLSGLFVTKNGPASYDLSERKKAYPSERKRIMGPKPLSELPLYGVCRVESIEDCPIRDRLCGLGFSKGAQLVALFAAPGGDPVAYSVRGTVVALRKSDAEKILVWGSDGWA